MRIPYNKSIPNICLVLLAVLACHISLPADSTAFLVEYTVARVGDTLITLTDLKAFTVLYPGFDGELTGWPSDRLILKVVEQRLLYLESKRLQNKLDTSELDKKQKKLEGRYKSRKDYIGTLDRLGVNNSIIIEELKKQVMATMLVEDRIKPFVFVSPHEVSDYYNKNRDTFPDALSSVEGKIEKIIFDEKLKRRVSQFTDKLKAKTVIDIIEHTQKHKVVK